MGTTISKYFGSKKPTNNRPKNNANSNNQSGGGGFAIAVNEPSIGNRPVIKGYDSTCIYNRSNNPLTRFNKFDGFNRSVISAGPGVLVRGGGKKKVTKKKVTKKTTSKKPTKKQTTKKRVVKKPTKKKTTKKTAKKIVKKSVTKRHRGGAYVDATDRSNFPLADRLFDEADWFPRCI